MPLPNEEMFNSNMDWIHSLMLNTTRQNFLRRIEKLDNVVLLSPHRAPFMDRFLGEFIKGSRDRLVCCPNRSGISSLRPAAGYDEHFKGVISLLIWILTS